MKALKIFCFILLAIFVTNLRAADSAVIIMYHRFGDERYPSTNIRLDQFDQQLAYLKSGGYHVLPLMEIIGRLKNGEALPDKTVGIAIDDGFETTYTQAWPRLKKAGFPFTLFVATGPIGNRGMMTWAQVKELAAAGVTIGNHTETHPYLETISPEAVIEDITAAQQKLTKELGTVPTLFAYPYGEYDNQVVDIVKKLGFKAAFAQVSGAIGPQSNFYLLQRFPLNENYGDLNRFKMILQTKALPIADISPNDPVLVNNNPPTISFKVLNKNVNLAQLNCYATDVGKLTVKLLAEQNVQLSSPKAFSKGRTHINCTLPAGKGNYYWAGLLYIV